jgi:hypothetical protein
VASSRRKGRVNELIFIAFIFAAAGMLVAVNIFIDDRS